MDRGSVRDINLIAMEILRQTGPIQAGVFRYNVQRVSQGQGGKDPKHRGNHQPIRCTSGLLRFLDTDGQRLAQAKEDEQGQTNRHHQGQPPPDV